MVTCTLPKELAETYLSDFVPVQESGNLQYLLNFLDLKILKIKDWQTSKTYFLLVGYGTTTIYRTLKTKFLIKYFSMSENH